MAYSKDTALASYYRMLKDLKDRMKDQIDSPVSLDRRLAQKSLGESILRLIDERRAEIKAERRAERAAEVRLHRVSARPRTKTTAKSPNQTPKTTAKAPEQTPKTTTQVPKQEGNIVLET